MAFSWSKLCRLCAASDDYHPIFQKYKHDKMLHEIVLKYLPITIGLDYDSKICDECGDRVMDFHSFTEHCEKIQRFFQMHMNITLIENHQHLQDLKSKFLESDPLYHIKQELDIDFSYEHFDNDNINEDYISHLNIDNECSLKLIKKHSKSLKKSKNKFKIIKNLKKKHINCSKVRKQENNINICDINKALTCELDLEPNVKLENDTPDIKRKFNCHLCEKEFKKWGHLENHVREHHSDRPNVKCPCKKTIKTKRTLERHIKTHIFPGDNSFKCQHCEKIFTTSSSFKEHVKTHFYQDLDYTCQTCGKSFAKFHTLKRHENTHLTYEERYIWKCEQCNIKYCTKEGLEQHKKFFHEKQKHFMCDFCGKSFSRKVDMQSHKTVHTNEKNFICNDCQKSFATKSRLIVHMKVHSDIAYQCPHCLKLLSTHTTLKNHLVIHSDQAKFICSYCNKACKRRKDLVSHLKKHTGERPYACQWCSLKFSNASNFRLHKKREHPIEFEIAEKSNPFTTLIGTKREKIRIIQPASEKI